MDLCNNHPEIQVSSQLIADTSRRSFNFHGGILAIENQIRKAFKSSEPHLAEKFLQLSNLYKHIGEDDIVLGISEKELAKQPLTQRALAKHLQGDFLGALKIYEMALSQADENLTQIDPTEQERSYWEHGRLECMVNLSRWKDLAENTLNEVSDDLSLLFNSHYMDPFLGYYIHSHMKMKQFWPSLWKWIDHLTPGQKNLVERRFSLELSFVALSRDDFDRGLFYTKKSYENFLADWSSLHSFDFSGRHNKLQSLQMVSNDCLFNSLTNFSLRL